MTHRRFMPAVAVLAAAFTVPAGALRAQQVGTLDGATPPANAVWVDGLDLSQLVGAGRPRPGQAAIRVRAARGATPAPVPITLGGTTFVHGLGVTSNGELWIDLHGAARRFVAEVGIDDARATGRGSVTFEVWVDGKRRYDSGVLRSGDAPRPVSVDLAGAHRMILYVGNGGDDGRDDVADWGGAAIVMAVGASSPATTAPPTEAAPAIAPIHTSGAPMLNYPRITGATPGRPFLFRIPASGTGPLRFQVSNLPPGLSVDEHTGVITGTLQRFGPTLVTVTISGPGGKTTGRFTIVGGTTHAGADAAAGVEFVECLGTASRRRQGARGGGSTGTSGLAATRLHVRQHRRRVGRPARSRRHDHHQRQVPRHEGAGGLRPWPGAQDRDLLGARSADLPGIPGQLSARIAGRPDLGVVGLRLPQVRLVFLHAGRTESRFAPRSADVPIW